MQKEFRNITDEIKVDDSRKVEGYAIVFNSLSEDLGGFRELITPEAIDGVIESSDIYALLNHSAERGILARSRYGAGTLSLTVDEKGIKYSFDSPHTALGDEVIEYLKRGDISKSSFAFTVAEDNWDKQDDGTYIRTIKKFDKLYDVSPVFEPAYQETSVTCARFKEIQENEKKLIDEKLNEQNHLEKYYKELNKKYLLNN